MTLPFESAPSRTPRLDNCRCLALACLLINAPLARALDLPQHPGASIGVRNNAELTLPARHYRGPRTYLAMIGPEPLHFEKPPAELPPEPVMPKPPSSTASPPEPLSAKTPGSAQATLAPPGSTATEQPNQEPLPKDMNTANPVLILPDDIKHEVRPEDVLPYFQFPGGNESVPAPFTPGQPRAPAQPPSSATYQQK